MFGSRRKHIIKILEERKNILQYLPSLKYPQWKVTTDALITSFIGAEQTNLHKEKFEDLDLSEQPKNQFSPKSHEQWLSMQKHFATEYIDSCIDYVKNGGRLTDISNWFCRRSVAELNGIIFGFLSLFFGLLLPFTCKQGERNANEDLKIQVENLKAINDSLFFKLSNCSSNVPKTKNNAKKHN